MSIRHINSAVKFVTFIFCLAISMALYNTTQASTDVTPQVIPDDVKCGKCGMFPAHYPQWQTQIIFKDGSMTPFDGCKCMFGFMNNMQKFDTAHTKDDIAAIFVRDFNTGDWLDAKTAHFVIGSDAMGPMGKELIPFKDEQSAEAFQKEHGGDMAAFDAITMETLKPLMGKMNGHMKMEGNMKQEGNMKMDENMKK